MSRVKTIPVNGAALRALRVKDGLSINQLAQRACVAHSHISYIERGMKEPSEEALNRLARALAVPTAALVGPVDDQDSEDAA